MNWSRTSETEEDCLDADLDLLLKGGKPEGPLGETAERVLRLASEGGLLSSRTGPAAVPRKPATRMPLTFLNKRRWRIAMSLTSTAAVVAVVLTMTFGGMPTAFWSDTNNDDSRLQLAAQDSTPACEQIRQDTGLEGNCTSTPSPRPDNSGIVMAGVPRALTAEDCTVEPRSREDMIEVLSTLPEAPTYPILDSNTVSEPPTLDNFHEDMDASVALTQEAYDQAQAAFFQWQACTTFYLTWQWAAVESDARLRDALYIVSNSDGRGPNTFLNTTEPYSEATLNEILDGWEASEAVSGEHLAESGFTGNDEVFVIDPTSVFSSADGTRLSGSGHLFIGGVDSETLPNDGAPLLPLSVSMVLENGAWRLDSYIFGLG